MTRKAALASLVLLTALALPALAQDSPPHLRWRVVACLEGESDELSLIGELQWHLSKHVFIELNSGFGLTEKAPDLAPEVGVMISF